MDPQRRSGQYEEEKILDPTGTQTLTLRLSSPLAVAIPNALLRLLKLKNVDIFHDQSLLKPV
jgi:hypothetical protein